MAEKFIANLNYSEIKAFLKQEYDARYRSLENDRAIDEDFDASLAQLQYEECVKQLIYKRVPVLDFYSKETVTVC